MASRLRSSKLLSSDQMKKCHVRHLQSTNDATWNNEPSSKTLNSIKASRSRLVTHLCPNWQYRRRSDSKVVALPNPLPIELVELYLTTLLPLHHRSLQLLWICVLAICHQHTIHSLKCSNISRCHTVVVPLHRCSNTTIIVHIRYPRSGAWVRNWNRFKWAWRVYKLWELFHLNQVVLLHSPSHRISLISSRIAESSWRKVGGERASFLKKSEWMKGLLSNLSEQFSAHTDVSLPIHGMG